MKKVLFFVSVLLFLSGCDGNDTLTCRSTNTVNGLTSNTTYKIDYKDDDVKLVTITYDYTNDTTNNNNNTNNNTNNGTNTDGVGTGTDGTTNDSTNDGNDGIVDGIVGDALDDVITGVTNTILDISGIRTTHTNRMTTYSNVEGFTSNVDTDTDNNYKVTYEINMDEIDDSDLNKFNVDRSLNTLRINYTNQGLTCE